VDGLVFIGHGRSDVRALVSAVSTARRAIEGRLLDSLRDEISSRLGHAEPALAPAA
jgi:glycerol-3-phosphate acyltransferase PlsX